jgi:hypothetical protein
VQRIPKIHTQGGPFQRSRHRGGIFNSHSGRRLVSASIAADICVPRKRYRLARLIRFPESRSWTSMSLQSESPTSLHAYRRSDSSGPGLPERRAIPRAVTFPLLCPWEPYANVRFTSLLSAQSVVVSPARQSQAHADDLETASVSWQYCCGYIPCVPWFSPPPAFPLKEVLRCFKYSNSRMYSTTPRGIDTMAATQEANREPVQCRVA